MADYSYLVLYLPRGTSRDAARRILTDHAEYGDWELARLRLNADGSRKATLRRPIIRPFGGCGPPQLVFAAEIPCELGFAPPGRAAQGPTSTLRAADPPALLRRKGLAAALPTRASPHP